MKVKKLLIYIYVQSTQSIGCNEVGNLCQKPATSEMDLQGNKCLSDNDADTEEESSDVIKSKVKRKWKSIGKRMKK